MMEPDIPTRAAAATLISALTRLGLDAEQPETRRSIRRARRELIDSCSPDPKAILDAVILSAAR